MRNRALIYSLGLALCLSIASAAAPARPGGIAPAPDFGKIPLYFVANQGQTDAAALFYAKAPAYTLWLTREGLLFDGARMAFRGARPDAVPTASEPTDHVVSYFYGRDESGWRTGIPTTKAVRYENLYDGIDLKVYGTETVVEYDWVVKPGADPARIAFGYDGTASVRLGPDGDLVVETAKGTLRHRRPASYQEIDGARVEVASAFRANGDGTYGFALGPYDRSRELVIDPLVLVFSTYLGGTTYDMAEGIGVDANGAVYVTGYTDSLDFPPRTVRFPRRDAFIIKFAPDGQSLVYSAFFPLGLSIFSVASTGRALLPEGVDAGADRRLDGRPDGRKRIMISGTGASLFSVDASGAAYLAGATSNNHFPVQNAFQPEYGGGWMDGFFLKLSPDGKSLVFSSYYGGSFEDYLTALAVDAEGALYLAGDRSRFFFINFPVSRPGAADGEDPWHGVFVAKMTADGRTRVFEKMIEMSGSVRAITDIAVDAAGAVYGTGVTSSVDLPVKNAFQRKIAGWLDCFVFKLDPAGADLAYCSYFGGPNIDFATAIAVDGKGSAYLTGYTFGTVPVKSGFRMSRRGSSDGFLAKLEADGKSLAWSTYFGGEGWDIPMDLALDASGRAHVVGETSSRYFHVKDAYKSVLTGTYDGFLSVFTPNGRSLDLSTLFGGSSSDSISCLALEADGGICLAGRTNGRDLPLLEPFQAGFGGGYLDAFVVKFKR